MSNTEFFNKMVAAGADGEDIIMPMLPVACKCWRGVGVNIEGHYRCCQPPQLIDKRKDRAFQEVLDIDAQLHFNCSGCPVFKKLGADGDTEKDEWHEIKTNYETHGESASGSGKAYTQNLAIETVENKYWKKNHIYETGIKAMTDPRNGDTVCVYNGAGWFNKTTDIEGHRILADWYHFYQPIKAERATQEEIDRWLNDDAVPAGSTLIIQYPFSYCISIRGSYLEKIATAATEIIDPDYGEEFATLEPRYKEVDIGKQKVKLIPIADILPCMVYRRGWADLEAAEGTGEWFSQDDIITFIAGDSIIQKPFRAASEQYKTPMRYKVRRIYESVNHVYEPQRVSIRVNGKEIVIAEGAGIEAITITPQQEKHRVKQDAAQRKYWTDKYSDLYLMPEVLEKQAAAAESY